MGSGHTVFSSGYYWSDCAMPSKVTKRGIARWKAVAQFKGRKAEKLFPDLSRASRRAAEDWEREAIKAMEAEARLIGTESLTVLSWANAYLDHAREYMSLKTYQEKAHDFRLFIGHVGPESAVSTIGLIEAETFLSERKRTASGYAANKARKNLAVAYKWGTRHFRDTHPEAFSGNPFRESARAPEERSPRYVPPEADFWRVFHTITDIQDRAIMLAFIYLAGRRSEIFGIRMEDIDFGGSRVRLFTRKRSDGTREYDWIPMIAPLREGLLEWVSARPINADTLFFVGKQIAPHKSRVGKPFVARQHWLKRLCHAAGVRPFDYHSIRHLSATILFHAGVPIGTIQMILRHKSAMTTERYLQKLGLGIALEQIEHAFGDSRKQSAGLRVVKG